MLEGFTCKCWSNEIDSGSDETQEFVDRRERARGSSGAESKLEENIVSLQPVNKNNGGLRHQLHIHTKYSNTRLIHYTLDDTKQGLLPDRIIPPRRIKNVVFYLAQVLELYPICNY